MACSICAHHNRAAIENALLNMDPANTSLTLKEIAKNFGVTENDLKIHALMHVPLGVYESDFDESKEKRGSLTRQMKLREADLLSNVISEYMVTLKNLGSRINTIASDPADTTGAMFAKLITKPVSDLYIGLGGEIRSSVKTIAEINQMLNGPETASTSGLQALAQAIAMSSKQGGGEDK